MTTDDQLAAPLASLRIGPPPPPQVATGIPTDEPGPGPEPGGAVPDDWAVEARMIEVSEIRTYLEAFGETWHEAGKLAPRSGRFAALQYIGTEEFALDQWKFTEAELDTLAPPLTRIINARPAARAAVAKGDHALVAITLAKYTGTNFVAGMAARKVAALTTEDWEHGNDQREAAGAPGPADGSAPGAGVGPDLGPVGPYGGPGVGIAPPEA